MKNIHVLPTDQPSTICKVNNVIVLLKIGTITNDTKSLIRQNIYITSDEQIKDVRPHKNKWQLEQGQILNKFPTYLTDLSECKLVIMTTDQDLIADGVQAIDDEFLEWFVNNPNCEWVEVVKEEFYSKNNFINGRDAITYNYKIIIPSKKPKYPIGGYAPGYYSCTCVTCKSTFQGDKRAVQCEPCAIKITKEEPKQETLKEAAEIDLTKLCYYDKRNPDFQIKEKYGYDIEEVEATGNFAKKDCACDNCFYGRSKLTEQLIWQKERMYSEKEVDNLISNILYEVRYDYSDIDVIENNIIELFEQFKKK